MAMQALSSFDDDDGAIDAEELARRIEEAKEVAMPESSLARTLSPQGVLGPNPPDRRSGHELAGVLFLLLLFVVPLRFLYNLARQLDPVAVFENPALLLDALAPSSLLGALTPFPLLGAVVATVLLFVFVKPRIAQKKLGETEIVFKSSVVRRGGLLRVKITMAPRSEIEVLKATLRIEAEESYQPQVSSTATRDGGWERTALRETTSKPIGQIFRPGLSEEVVMEITVPPTAPTTLNTPPYYVEWRAVTTIEIASWPDLVDQQTIAVIP
ncbi:MAG: hypothetical protein V3T72_04380 [Thermoanaerobaculia bacterium]